MRHFGAKVTSSMLLVLLSCSGEDGGDGLSSLVFTESEAPGGNCSNGGMRVSWGLDRSGDGKLDGSEISGTAYLCHGGSNDGSLQALVEVNEEAAGEHCTDGGQEIRAGLDSNRDGLLQSSEVSWTRYVCHGSSGATGEPGQPGRQALIVQSVESPGENCSDGGVKIESGVDEDGDGSLSTNEVIQTTYVCHGASGSDGQPGADGQSGADGLPGADGNDGKAALVTQKEEPAGANCVVGGVRIDSGIDEDGDGNLSENEIDQTTYVCRSVGSLVRVQDEPAGANCEWGGLRIDQGLDDGAGDGTAGDGILHDDEVLSTNFVCASGAVRQGMLFRAQNEDYFDFGPQAGFMDASAWSIVEMVRIPDKLSLSSGWHMFRGEAWQDMEGDVAIGFRFDSTPRAVNSWLRRSTYVWEFLDWEDVEGDVLVAGRWITIGLQRGSGNDAPLELWIDGLKRSELPLSGNVNDSFNVNPLYFGGQYVDPSYTQGDLYTEEDIILAHQLWQRRILSPLQMLAYDGTNGIADSTTFFSATLRNESGVGVNFYNPVSQTFATIGNSPQLVSLP